MARAQIPRPYDLQRLGARSGPVPELELEPGTREPACDRGTHLAGAEDGDPGEVRRSADSGRLTLAKEVDVGES
jgi:hypothetical protein